MHYSRLSYISGTCTLDSSSTHTPKLWQSNMLPKFPSADENCSELKTTALWPSLQVSASQQNIHLLCTRWDPWGELQCLTLSVRQGSAASESCSLLAWCPLPSLPSVCVICCLYGWTFISFYWSALWSTLNSGQTASDLKACFSFFPTL